MAQRWTTFDYSRHAIRELWINGLQVPPPEVQSAEVHQSEYMHDYFCFRIVWTDVRALPESTGWLVQCRWGMDIAQGYFYGYVQSVQIVENRINGDSNQRLVQFECLGATSTMQSGQQRSFPGMSADNVAKSVIQPYHLALVADPSSYRWPSLVQTGATDWAFLVDLARKIGYVLTSYKVTVFFIDPLRVVKSTGSSILVQGMSSNQSNPGIIQGSLTVGNKANNTEFTNTVVRSVDYLGAQVGGSNVNDKRLSLLGATTVEPVTSRYDADYLPQDAKHAPVVVNSNNRPERWPYQAPLFCKGDGRLRPGVVANLGVGSNQLSGFWLVRSAVHQLGRAAYSMELQLARDSTTASPYTTPTITAGDLSGPLNAVAAPVVTNGKWASVWSA